MESAWRDALDGKVSMETAWKRKWSLSHVFTRISIVYHLYITKKKSLKQQHTSHFATGTMNASSLLNNTATAAPVIQEMERAYEFVDKNPYEKDQNAFLKGQAAFKRGEINEAIYLLESAVQQDDSNAEAWRLLGQSHAENDCDPQAIVCLERAVERDPYNLPALLALGVSYVNELDHNKALENLQAWVNSVP
jgi:tetratricopeptide (TPR) repeat protein